MSLMKKCVYTTRGGTLQLFSNHHMKETIPSQLQLKHLKIRLVQAWCVWMVICMTLVSLTKLSCLLLSQSLEMNRFLVWL